MRAAPIKPVNPYIFERLPGGFLLNCTLFAQKLFFVDYMHRALQRRKFEVIRPLDHDFRGSGSLKLLDSLKFPS